MQIAMEAARNDALPQYPAQLVQLRRLPEGAHIVIRPIHPDDDALERSFINGLSSDTRYNRLLSGRKLTPEEIRKLTRIDYQREMAFIALGISGSRFIPLGVARYVRDAEGTGAEFAIVIADAWQGKGVGTVLLRALLAQARAAGIGQLHGIRLATNQAMHNLARKLGFTNIVDPLDATVRQVVKTLTPAAGSAAGYATPRSAGAALRVPSPELNA